MPDDTITLVSTTDTPEQVQAALTNKPVAAPPAEEPAPADTADAPPAAAEETAEQKDTREASEAGSKLAARRKKIQDDIDADIRRKHDVRRDADAEEVRLVELRRQRQVLEAAAEPVPKGTPAPATAATGEGRDEPQLDAVDADGNAKYATYENYLSDHAKWTREEAVLAAKQVLNEDKTNERARIEHDSTTRVVHERLATYNANLDTFKKTHADFDAAFEDAKEAVQDTLVGLGPQALKVIDGFTIFDAEDGPALTYYLLKRPDELKAIALKPPQQQLVHLARLEERIRAGGAKSKSGPSPAAPETKAPAPIRPVGSGPTATTVPLDEESYQDYKARRSRELRARQGM